MPFWAWNKKLEKNELLEQIEIFKKMCFGGFNMQVRQGLEDEYLGKTYMDIAEKDVPTFKVPVGYRCVQTFDEETAKKICTEVNRQLRSAFRWLKKFEKKQKRV